MKIREMLSKKVTIAGKTIPAFLVVSILSVGLGSAALLTYYGRIVTTVDVHQSILLDGENYLTIQNDLITEPAPGGEKFCFKHWLKNQMSVEGKVGFTTTPKVEGITTTYLTGTGYSWSGTTGDQPINIDVEDGECQVTWTVDFPIDDDTCNGLMAVGLVVALDGEDNGPIFQIHNNDGTDPTYEWGTWLMSPWGPTIGDGWFGWHSGSINTPVAKLDWVEATGGRYREGKPDCPKPNPNGIFTITIDKCKLGEENIHWALYTAIGSGFCSHAYQQATYPSEFDWSTPIVTATNYQPAGIMESVTGLTIPSGAEQPFCLCYDFDQAIVPGTYTMTTRIVPA